MAVFVDVLEGARATHDLLKGWTLTRVAYVTGLNADGSLDTAALVQDAIAAVIGVVGGRGSPYPSPGLKADDNTTQVGSFLDHFDAEPKGSAVVKVSIVYRGYPLATLEFEGSYNTIETNIDVNGNPITTTYTYPMDYVPDPSLRGCTQTAGAKVSMAMPECIFTARFIIGSGTIGTSSASASQMMTYYKATYEGKINNEFWSLIPDGSIAGDKHTWLCEKMNGTSKDGGASYEAYMTFHHRETTWDETSTFIDPHTGQPPPDLISGTGLVTNQVRYDVAFPTITFGPN